MKLRHVIYAFSVAAALQAGESQFQVWPEANVFLKTSKTTRLFLLGSSEISSSDAWVQRQVGIHMDFSFKPILEAKLEKHHDENRYKSFVIRTGYLFSKSPADASKPYTENTALIELTQNFFLWKKIHLSERNRFDLNYKNGAFLPQYRNRVMLQRLYQLGKYSLTPYAHAEAFFDWQYDSFHRFRFASGGEFAFTKRIILDAYYLHQQDSRSKIRGTNVLGLKAQFYLR